MRRGVLGQGLVGLGLVSLVILPWVAGPYFVSVASFALVSAVLAMSAQLLIAAGQPTLDRAAYLGVGGYCAAIVSELTSLGPVQLAVSAVAASIAAGVLGPIFARTRGVATLLATFALGEAARVAAEQWRSRTGGGNGLSAAAINLWPGSAPLTGIAATYLYLLAVAAIVAVTVSVLVRSRFGVTLRAIANNEARVTAAGLQVTARLWTAYVIAGAMAGLAGAMLVAARQYIAVSDVGFGASAITLAAAIIGRRNPLLAGGVGAALVLLADLPGGRLTGFGPLLIGAALVIAAFRWRPRARQGLHP